MVVDQRARAGEACRAGAFPGTGPIFSRRSQKYSITVTMALLRVALAMGEVEAAVREFAGDVGCVLVRHVHENTVELGKLGV